MNGKFALFTTAVLAALVGSAMAADTVPGTGHYIGDEIPFVEGQSAPAAPQGYSWCLERRKAMMEEVRQQVCVREESWYLETTPAQYETRMEKVMTEPAQKRAILISPAVYRDVQEQKLIEPASEEYKTIPAQYAMVNEEVEVVPAKTEKEFIPAQYEDYTERIMIHPERTVREEVPGCDKDGGKIECYGSRTIPAEYQTITKKRLVAPARTETRVVPAEKRVMQVRKVVVPARVEKVTVPARYETVSRKVLDRPAEYRYEELPPKYTTVERKVVSIPEGQRRVKIPAKYDTVSSMRVVKPERLVWVLKSVQNATACPADAVSTLGVVKESALRDSTPADAPATSNSGANVDTMVKRYGRVPGTASGK